MVQMPIFTADTPAPMSDGGLRNAIVGSVMLAFSGLFVGCTDWSDDRYLFI